MRERGLVVRFTVAAAAIAVIALTATSARAQLYTFTTLAGPIGGPGSSDGTGTAARFKSPGGMATDSAGNMYIADSGNNVVRKLSPAGVVTTLAGRAPFIGSVDGTGGSARFSQPTAVAVDSNGNVFVTDSNNHTIRRIDPNGVVTTFAGLAGSPGSADGTGSVARFNVPTGVAVDSANNVLVADGVNKTIRKITPGGVVTTLAGLAGAGGAVNDTGSLARFSYPYGVAVDATDNLYVADFGARTLRKVTPAGVVTTPAGLAFSTAATVNGNGSVARFVEPLGVAVDVSGTIYVSDGVGHTIRAVTPGGDVTTYVGFAGAAGSVDGNGAAARLSFPVGVTTDSNKNLYIAEGGNHTIRLVTPSADVTTFAGLPGGIGTNDGTTADARFSNPYSVAFDVNSSDVFAGETYTIRKISGGNVTTFAGTQGAFGSSNGTGSAASFRYAQAIVVDAGQNLFVADTNNHTIRKITPAGDVTTFAGLAQTPGSTNDLGAAARFNFPTGIVIDNLGNLYVADHGNHTIRMITPGGMVSTLAGSPLSSGNIDGTGLAARFVSPSQIAIDRSGVLYVSDENAQTIRRVTTPGAVVTTLAGAYAQIGAVDDNGSNARFSFPWGIAVNSGGNVFVNDRGNSTIRMINPSGDVTTVGGLAGAEGDEDGTGSFARFRAWGLAMDNADRIYVADAYNNKIRIGRRALSDRATIDTTSGRVGDLRSLQSVPANGPIWSWALTRQPGTSIAEIQRPNASLAGFTPDVPGVYVFRLTAGTSVRSITSVTLNVGPMPTTTQLVSTPNPSTYGQNFTLTASVISEGTPAQSVSFFDGALLLGTVALNSASQAVLLVSTLNAGVHTLSASYSGDSDFDSSKSGDLTHTVNRAQTFVGCPSTLNPSTFGDSVTFTSSVNGFNATGTVTYKDGTTVLATNPLSGTPGSRFTSYTTTALSPGIHAMTATYNGDVNYLPSTSGTLSQSVHALFGAPPGLVATATSTTTVEVSWILVNEADHYEIVQMSGAAPVVTMTPSTTPATFISLTADTTYLYKIRAVKLGGATSAYSGIDPATTILFSDDPIVPGTTAVRAAHISEMRRGVNAMRASVNLAAALFTDPSLLAGARIKAVHLNELRTALAAARTAMGLTASYSDDPIVAGWTVMKAAHAREVRDAIK